MGMFFTGMEISMNKSTGVFVCALLTSSLMSSACTPQTSAERHARQYVYAADDGFDPNVRVIKADSIKMAVPFFKTFHDLGAKDRSSGMSVEDANKRADNFRSESFLNSIQSETIFAGTRYVDNKSWSAKQRKAMSDAISEAYIDGYEGRM